MQFKPTDSKTKVTSVAVGAHLLMMMEKFPCGKFMMTTVNL